MSSAASRIWLALPLTSIGGLAHALENFGEVVEHEVHGVDDVAERVVGDFAADGQVAAGHLIDRVEQVGDAALERILRLLVRDGVGDLRGAAIEVFGDERRTRRRYRFPRGRATSPATRRSENFASSPTGLSTRLLSTKIDGDGAEQAPARRRQATRHSRRRAATTASARVR